MQKYNKFYLIQEGGVFTGVVVCEGEGHLNARSCLLEGVGGSVRQKGVCVKMVVPDNVQCSLFPGQVRWCGKV